MTMDDHDRTEPPAPAIPDDAAAGALEALAGRTGEALALLGGMGAELAMPTPYASTITLIERTYLVPARGFGHNAGMAERIDRLDGRHAADREPLRLRLEREPDDARDQWAIKAFADDLMVGYVRAHEDEILARLMDGGKHLYAEWLKVEAMGHDGRRVWVKVVLDD